ncbi:MAG: integrase core domain-containing protein [Burkholderiales bacterium]
MIERFFLHCKTALGGAKFTCAKALQDALNDFHSFYNSVHRHTSLGGRTPMETWHPEFDTKARKWLICIGCKFKLPLQQAELGVG